MILAKKSASAFLKNGTDSISSQQLWFTSSSRRTGLSSDSGRVLGEGRLSDGFRGLFEAFFGGVS